MSLSRLYLKFLGFIYTIAFLSYYVQYPALSSRSGIEPSEDIFRQAFPQIYHNMVEKGYSDTDSFVELLNVLSLILSVAIASGVVQHGILFLAVTSIYHFLVILGTSFYTFQWDILLVETGFLTGLCFAPWRTLTLQCNTAKSEQQVGSWPIRFLLFKLMFMSGVVKIQANCPTWQNLTALEYHFATQCLPGPFAWYAHQLHPLLLRLGVAATFIIEIPAAFLLLSPCVSMRKVGAWMQISLQVLIILTGSYNFFNLLTMTMCLPCMVGEESHTGNKKWRRLQHVLCALFLLVACTQMFTMGYTPLDPGRQVIGLKLAITKDGCNLLVERAIPIAVACTLLFTVVAGVRSSIERKSHRLTSTIHTLVCCLCITITAVPFLDLSPNLHEPAFLGFRMKSSTWRSIRRHSSSVSHGYGLFRRMTGVGQLTPDATSTSMGWAGMPPSIVARPEIILEVLVDGSEEWHELNFRWKPGGVNNRPLQAAPHQPRLDWRMWFAALGSIQHNPWLASFIYRILSERGCPDVLGLLNEPEILAGKQKINRVRANLYHYDFTRLDTEWARRIPDVKIVETTDSLLHYPELTWTRKMVHQYLPPLEFNNQSLLEFLQHAGYELLDCVSNDSRCEDIGTASQGPCRVASSIRKLNTNYSWAIPLTACLSCLISELLWVFTWQRKRKQSAKEKLKLE